MPLLSTNDLLTDDFVREEFGVSCKGIPLAGIRMIDGKTIRLYREADVIKPENTDAGG